MKLRLFRALLALAFLVGVLVPLNAQQVCSSKTAKATYGYSCTGVAPNPADGFKVEPFAAYGVVVSDGKGPWNGHGKVSFNGVVMPWTHDTRSNEPAVVNSDCTGSVTYQITVGGTAAPDAHFEFVIVNDGLEVKGFPVDNGYAAACQLIRTRS